MPLDPSKSALAWSPEATLDPLVDLMRHHPRVVVLTGAGISTESGIPDYRGPETRRRARNPIQYQGFMGAAATRQRYWARSLMGWPRMRLAQPNPAHHALARLERQGHIHGVITQNVDGLHHAAESRRVVELHGSLARVRCLTCHMLEPRAHLQQRLLVLNPTWDPTVSQVTVAPDGDADLEDARIQQFNIAGCQRCGGVLKPDVVFFGENVPRHVKDAAFALFAEADMLLVIGSSLAVYSGYRFVRQAVQRQLPVAMINLGPPLRGAEHADVHIDGRAGEQLPRLVQRLGE